MPSENYVVVFYNVMEPEERHPITHYDMIGLCSVDCIFPGNHPIFAGAEIVGPIPKDGKKGAKRP